MIIDIVFVILLALAIIRGIRRGFIVAIFSFIAIFVACLGLFGLSAFSISQRVKEIGIRKVLGEALTALLC